MVMYPSDDARADDIRRLIPWHASEEHPGWGDPIVEFVSSWIIRGLPFSNERLVPKHGVDKARALDHISRIIHTHTLNHDSKVKYCSNLMQEWFEPIK